MLPGDTVVSPGRLIEMISFFEHVLGLGQKPCADVRNRIFTLNEISSIKQVSLCISILHNLCIIAAR